MQGTFNAQQRH